MVIESFLERRVFTVDDSTCQCQFSIKPGVPQSSAISGNTCLVETYLLKFRNWGQTKARAISMSCNYFEPRLIRVKGITNCESNESGEIPCEIIFPSYIEFPILIFT